MTTNFITFLDTANWLVPVAIVVGLVLSIGIPAWLFLNWYIQPTKIEGRKETISLLLQTLGGVAFVLGGWFTWQQLINSREELKNSRDALIITQQGQITERFTRAIDQLGKSDDEEDNSQKKGVVADSGKNLAIRLGGIYALERISRDSETDYFAVMEILTAFVRQHALWTVNEKTAPVKQDIQAILTVLGRRERAYGQGEAQRLDLSATDLRGAVLTNANLAGAILTSSHFEDANLSGAHLSGAQLSDARFNNSILKGAILRDTNLRGATLKGADVTDADFSGADLTGVDLREARGLTDKQINSAKSHAGMLMDPVAGQNP